MSQRKVLDSTIKYIKVDVQQTDVKIEVGNEKESVMECQNNVEVEQEHEMLLVEEKDNEDDYITITTSGSTEIMVGHGKGSEKVVMNHGRVLTENRKTILNNGNVLSVNPTVFERNQKHSINFILAKDKKYDFVIATTSGNVHVQNIVDNDLEICTYNGDIDLVDVDCNMIKTESVNGNINAMLLSTLYHYHSILKTLRGKIQQETFEKEEVVNPYMKKHVLDACSKNGNINVVFQGKKK